MTSPDSPQPDPQPDPVPAVQYRFETLAQALAVAIMTADQRSLVDYVNPAARELFWRPDEQLLGEGWLECVDLDDRITVGAIVAEVAKSGNADRADFRIDVAGYTRWVRARFNPLDPAVGGWVGIFDDVTADRATSDELARRAAHDPLTGLPNRTLLEDRLDQAIARSVRQPSPLAVFFLDLDQFKPINDRLGHKAGDTVLREVADRLRSILRTHDTAARLGGDEFVVVTERTDRRVAAEVADRIAAAVGQPLTVEGEVIHPKVSIGVAWSHVPRQSAAAIIDRADQAMYLAKRTGTHIAFAADL